MTYDACKAMLDERIEAAHVAACKSLAVHISERTANAWTDCVDYRLDVADAEGLGKHCLACGTTVKRGTGDV